MGEIEEVLTDEESPAEDMQTESMDFTSGTPKDFMPKDIDSVADLRKRRPQPREEKFTESEGEISEEDGDENPDFFDDSRSKRNDGSSTKKKLIAFLMISPMVISGLVMMSDAFERFNLNKDTMRITASVIGASIALYIMSKIPALQSALKFILCFAWIIFLLPTYQVYQCSPIELKNSMLGTWFKLNTGPKQFSESSYVTSECFRSFQLQAPYSLSLMSTKIRLVVQIEELINLDGSNKGREGEEGNADQQQQYHYFIAVSKRSVRKKFHNIYLIFEAQGKESDMLSKSLKLSRSEKDKNLLVVTGTVNKLEDELLPMKKELEKMNYIVRPVKFKILSVSYRDKYVKLKSNAHESMY